MISSPSDDPGSALVREISRVENRRSRDYFAEERVGLRAPWLFPARQLAAASLLVATLVVGLGIIVCPNLFERLARFEIGLLATIAAGMFAVATPLVAMYGALRSDDEFATEYVWHVAHFPRLIVLGALAVAIDIAVWFFAGISSPTPIFTAIFLPSILVAMAVTFAVLFSLVAVLLEVVVLARYPQSASQAGARYESLTFLKMLLERLEASEAGRQQDDVADNLEVGWQDRLWRRASKAQEDHNRVVFRHSLDSVHDAVTEFARILGRLNLSWPNYLDYDLRRYIWTHHSFLQQILAAVPQEKWHVSELASEFTLILQRSYHRSINTCARNCTLVLLDRYLTQLPWLYETMADYAEKHPKVENAQEMRAYWGTHYIAVGDLVGQLPEGTRDKDRAHLLLILHRNGTHFLRAAVKRRDTYLIQALCRALGDILVASLNAQDQGE